MPGLADLRLRPAEIAGFECRRESFVEPGRDVARGQRADQRVRELVRQHAVELGRLVERAAHRHADRPVVRARRPRRRPRDVAELLGRVQDDWNRIGGIDAEQRADAPIGAIERLERLCGKRRFGGPFERR
jgi:hypothetical protein